MWNKSIYGKKKKRLESKLCRKYVLNLLNEPQHLAKIKTPKLLKILNKGVTNLRERKVKNMQILRFRENKRKVREKMSMSVFQCQGKGSLTWLANLWNQACRACIPKGYEGGGERKRKIVIWNLEIFYNLHWKKGS